MSAGWGDRALGSHHQFCSCLCHCSKANSHSKNYSHNSDLTEMLGGSKRKMDMTTL